MILSGRWGRFLTKGGAGSHREVETEPRIHFRPTALLSDPGEIFAAHEI
jgi:hypothetical protein